jgi:hypothetical protein
LNNNNDQGSISELSSEEVVMVAGGLRANWTKEDCEALGFELCMSPQGHQVCD